MKIRLISDVHFEFYEDRDLYKSQGEDVLVIAGDMAVGLGGVLPALTRFSKEAKHIVYTPGNHEYYNNSITEFDNGIKECTRASNIHFLNPGTIKIDDVTFIGATLWSNFRNNTFSRMHCAKFVNDFSMIKKFSTQACAELYDKHIAYFREAEQVVEGKKVFVSHFLPAIECIASQYRGEGAINDYFANDLGEWISYMENSTWLFGHSHTATDLTLGNTRVKSNPYGYHRNEFYKECLIEV